MQGARRHSPAVPLPLAILDPHVLLLSCTSGLVLNVKAGMLAKPSDNLAPRTECLYLLNASETTKTHSSDIGSDRTLIEGIMAHQAGISCTYSCTVSTWQHLQLPRAGCAEDH